LPDATFTGLGGNQMAEAGQRRVVNAEEVAVMGLTEILRHIPHIYASYRKLVASIRRERPDIAVLIDFPDVNFRLAKHLRKMGVPVVWFVSPQLWAWKRGRLRWVQQRVDKMLVIFPFEELFYRQRGVDAEFVGHPLALQPIKLTSREAYAEQFQLDPEKTWIALLPGSRWKEIHANLPALHELAMSDLISSSAAYTTFDGDTTRQPNDPAAHTRYEFLLPVASTIDLMRRRRCPTRGHPWLRAEPQQCWLQSWGIHSSWSIESRRSPSRWRKSWSSIRKSLMLCPT
jgi:lipid-A-disaccharide synthase